MAGEKEPVRSMTWKVAAAWSSSLQASAGWDANASPVRSRCARTALWLWRRMVDCRSEGCHARSLAPYDTLVSLVFGRTDHLNKET